MKLLKISQIVTTAGTQIRAAICENTVTDYAEAMAEGSVFPPIIVFHDGSQYILADGFHRVMAATRNGFKDFECEVRTGTKSDALKFALAANAAHGLKRTNADKRRSVELALAEWSKLSDREIARICAVGDHLVADVRKTNCVNDAVETRTGADGKARKLPARKQEKAAEPEQAPEPEPQYNAEPVNPFKNDAGTMSAGEEHNYTIDDLRRDRDAIIADMIQWTEEALTKVDIELTMAIAKAARNELKRRIK